MKISYVKQTDLRDCGVSCLMSLIKYYKGYASREYLREITKTTKDGVSVYSLIEAASILGFEARALRGDVSSLKDKVPVIAHLLIDKKIGHFVIITKIDKDNIIAMDPSFGFKKYSLNEWKNISTNVYIEYKPKTNIISQSKEKNFISIIFPILKKYKKTFLIIFLCSCFYIIFNILLSYQFEFFLNSKGTLIKKIFYILILITFLKELIYLYRNNLINYLNHRLDKDLISEIYNHIIRLPYLYFKNRTKGDIITRIKDIFIIRDFISNFLITISIDFLFLIVISFLIFRINFKLSFIVFIMTIIYLFILLIYKNIIINKYKLLKDQESIFTNYLIESLGSINTVKGMQLEDYLNDKLQFHHNNLSISKLNLNKSIYNESFFKEIVHGICILIIIYIGIIEVFNQNMSLTKLLVFNSLIIYYFISIDSIGNLSLLFKNAKISFLRIKELLNIREENLNISRKKIDKHLRGNILISNLNYSYNGINNNLVCNELKIKESTKVLVYGISGGGKSTLMKILVRYLNNYKGKITIDDRDLFNYDLVDIRNKISYISQDEILFTDTIYNNIVLNNNVPYSKYLEIIKLTGVDKLIERSILKDDMILENDGDNLSGGERQRIIIARSLIKNSDVYIFDESFSALDIKSERIVLKNIFLYLKNKTVIVISHRFNNRDLYQKFILIDKGIVYEY